MKKVTLSDFSGGMIERVSPEDYVNGEAGRLFGFVPEDDKSIRTQWAIQSIGTGNSEDENWVEAGSDQNSAHLIAVYPIRGYEHVYLIALKDDGSIWWTRAPSGQETHEYTTDNLNVAWNELTDPVFGYAKNVGYDEFGTYDYQPEIKIERNPDYRFICELPFEIYKYIKQPAPGSTTVSGTGGGTKDNYLMFDKDELPELYTYNDVDPDSSFTGISGTPPRSVTSAILLHSRRYYNNGVLSRGVDIKTIKNVTNAVATKNTATTPDTMTCTLTANNHGYNVGDLVKVNLNGSATTQNTFNGSFYITAKTTNTFTYTYQKDGVSAYTSAAVTGTSQTVSRTQVAVVCYVDPSEKGWDGKYGVIKAVTFPNIRRWPTYITAGTGYNTLTSPMLTWAVRTNKTQGTYQFISEYPFGTGQINNITTGTSAYPKDTNVFHPYTYLDKNKLMLPGTGFIPRANIGTMFGSHLILGDIEWREDMSEAYLNETKLTPTANTVVMSNKNASFGLRDGNTEPHRGFFYYSEDEIDKFDPRSVLRSSGTDTRIAGIHTVNNRLITITTSGGQNDGVIAWAGNLSAIHPYKPGVVSNPLSMRKEIIRGGLGTADTHDSYNHGNPQTCLWAEFGWVCFIDKSGYVYKTDGAQCELLDERLPIKGRPIVSTVNDHVASVGKHLFVYKDGYLFCYTLLNGRGAWSILKRPQAFWQVKTTAGYYKTYNVIRSMRGIGNELYFVVHSYYQDTDENYNALPNTEPVLAKSRVMRYAINGPAEERGCQDGIKLDGLEFETPSLGNAAQSTKTNWFMVGVNFYTEAGCVLNGIQVKSVSPGNYSTPITYTKGYIVDADPTLDGSYNPIYGTDLGVFTNGYHSFEIPAGIGPQHVLTARFNFRGDVKIEGVNVCYTGNTEIIGGL